MPLNYEIGGQFQQSGGVGGSKLDITSGCESVITPLQPADVNRLAKYRAIYFVLDYNNQLPDSNRNNNKYGLTVNSVCTQTYSSGLSNSQSIYSRNKVSGYNTEYTINGPVGSVFSKQDYCDGNNVAEYACNENQGWTERSTNCQYGCSNGVCNHGLLSQ